jgi:hypothetical protein
MRLLPPGLQQCQQQLSRQRQPLLLRLVWPGWIWATHGRAGPAGAAATQHQAAGGLAAHWRPRCHPPGLVLPWQLCLVLGRWAAAAVQCHCQQLPWLHPEGCRPPRLLLLLLVPLPLMLADLLLPRCSPTCSCARDARQQQQAQQHCHYQLPPLVVPQLGTAREAAARQATWVPGGCPAQAA